MNDEQRLAAALIRTFGCQNPRCKQVQGMWVVEVVIANADQQQRVNAMSRIPEVVRQTLNQVVWKSFVYSSFEDRFTEQGTLHTVSPTWEDGMQTTTLAGSDCFLDITAFDAEILQMGPPRGYAVLGKEAMNNGAPLLGYQQVQHIWLEAMGGNYRLADPSVNLIQSRIHPYELEVILAT